MGRRLLLSMESTLTLPGLVRFICRISFKTSVPSFCEDLCWAVCCASSTHSLLLFLERLVAGTMAFCYCAIRGLRLFMAGLLAAFRPSGQSFLLELFEFLLLLGSVVDLCCWRRQPSSFRAAREVRGLAAFCLPWSWGFHRLVTCVTEVVLRCCVLLAAAVLGLCFVSAVQTWH